MIHASARSRQPSHTAWTRKRLLHERAIALGHAIDASSAQTYNSHLQSYLTFCKLHNFPIGPTADTLSFYVVFMSHHISPKSVGAYLSGICNTLEPHFPSFRKIRHDNLVKRTLAGMKKLRGSAGPNLLLLLARFNTGEYEDKLFLAILLAGFHSLMRLGELTQPDAKVKRSFTKLTMCHSPNITADKFSFHLPYHKGDHFFEGNTILIEARSRSELCPLIHISSYVADRDAQFALYPELWLTSVGEVPTYSWFIKRLRSMLGSDVAGHSLRSGGATALALARVCDDLIQAIGRWASDTFRIYIRKHPVLLHALIHGKPAFSTST
jgi:hypothetical protein